MVSGAPDFYRKIETILKIRDMTHRPVEFIQNSSFEEGFVGWYPGGAAQIVDAPMGYGKCLKLPANVTSWCRQDFPIALNVNWFTRLFFFLRASQLSANVVTFYYAYTDGTSSNETFGVSGANVWEIKDCHPTPGKILYTFNISHLDTYTMDTYVDDFTMVF